MARFFIDEKKDVKNIIYKARVIGNAYNPVYVNELPVVSAIDGEYNNSEEVKEYFYKINDIDMTIIRHFDGVHAKESYDLIIKYFNDQVYNSKNNFFLTGRWEETFDAAYNKAKLQIESINSMDNFSVEEHKNKEKTLKIQK